MHNHIFKIPSWLPYLPQEIWVNIFYYKWRMEIKDVLKNLPSKEKTCFIGENEMAPRRKSGNFWFKYLEHPFTKKGLGWHYGIEVKVKCGIEILNWKNVLLNIESPKSFPMFYNQETLSRYMRDNLNINCNKDVPWDELFKLCRNI